MKNVIFDIESTGPDKSKDRIIQLAIKLIDDKGKVLLNKSKLYNPGIPISQAAFETHGISDEMVKNAPTFKEDAKKLKAIFEDSVLIGYNLINFDIPMLMCEFERAGIDINLSGKVIDVMRLETALNPRTLSAVYERYTGKQLDGAHDAMNDVNATEIILGYQKDRIRYLRLNNDEMMAACGVPENAADFFGKFLYDDDGDLIYNFGKHVNLKVLANSETRKYAQWMLGEAFPGQVKKLLQNELKKDITAQFKRNVPSKSDVIDSKPQITKTAGKGFYPITQQMISDHNRTGKPFEQLQAEKEGFSFRSGVQGKLINDQQFDDDLPF